MKPFLSFRPIDYPIIQRTDEEELRAILLEQMDMRGPATENAYQLSKLITNFNANSLERLILTSKGDVKFQTSFEIHNSMHFAIPRSARDPIARIFWKTCMNSKFKNVLLRHLYIRDIDADTSNKYDWCSRNEEYIFSARRDNGDTWGNVPGEWYTTRIKVDLGRHFYFDPLKLHKEQVVRTKLFQ